MSHSPYTERIIGLLRDLPGLNDDEIAERLGINPRQTVNHICRRLDGHGVLTRTPGPTGKIVNYLRDSSPIPSKQSIGPVGTLLINGGSDDSLVSDSLSGTLVVLPCSRAKRREKTSAEAGSSVLESLPLRLAQELREARTRSAHNAHVDETVLVPAYERYNGALYRIAHVALKGLLDRGTHLVILSGAYGIVAAREPIGLYDAVLKPSLWPDNLLERCLVAYVEHHGLSSVRAFAAASSPYCHVLQRVPWKTVGITDALLLTPRPGPGGISKSPRCLGEALIALSTGTLTSGWQSSHGLKLEIR